METIRYSNAIWTCADGKRIWIQDMTSKHIHNCINKIETEDFRNEWLRILEYELELRSELDKLRIELEKDRHKILRQDSIDKDDLFDRPLSQTIHFLQDLFNKHGDVKIKEVWYGYEENDIVIEYESAESDDEFESRIYESLHNRREKLEERFDNACDIRDEMRSLQQQMDDLDSKLKNMS